MWFSFFDLQTLSGKSLNSHSLLISSSNGNSLTFSILPFKSYIIQVSYVTFVVTVEGRFLLGILVLWFFSSSVWYGFQTNINVQKLTNGTKEEGGCCILGPISLHPVVAVSPCGIYNLHISLLILHTNPVYGFLLKKSFQSFFFIEVVVLTVLYGIKDFYFL